MYFLERPKKKMFVLPKTYADFVANLAFFLIGLPIGLLCMTISALPILCWMSCGAAHCLWWSMHYGVLGPLHWCSRQLILTLCICLHPYAYFSHRTHNSAAAIHTHPRRDPDYSSQLWTEVQCSIGKEGFWYVYVRLMVMYSFLPAWRHAFCTNPVLFKYRFHLTNRSTHFAKPARVAGGERMVRFLWEYILDLTGWKYDKQMLCKTVRFAPSYFNNKSDFDLTDYNNVGIQLTRWCAFLVRLETLVKTRADLMKNIENKHYTLSIMQDSHPLRLSCKLGVMEQAGGSGGVQAGGGERVGILTVILPYDHIYHPLCCFMVEVNVQCTPDYQLEHPMLGLAHDGTNLTALWTAVDGIFENKVWPYVEAMSTHARL